MDGQNPNMQPNYNNYGANPGYQNNVGYQQPPQPNYGGGYANYAPNPLNPNRLMKAWGYIGYMMLYCIPLVGFIFIIVHALDNTYINRRNFARSYLWLMLISIIISIVFTIIAFVIGLAAAASGNY